jgi:amino acid transporter
MNSAATAEVLPDRRRLTYIAENFTALQGLNSVALGAMLVASEIVGLHESKFPLLGAGGALLVVMVLLLVAMIRWIPRYYEKRFGRVEPRRESYPQLVILLGVVAIAAIALVAFNTRIHLVISDPGRQVELLPLILWTLGMFNEVSRWRRSGWSRMGFLLTCTLAWVLLVLLQVWHPETRQTDWWKILNATSFGLGMIALGLYDHFTLVRLLPKRVEKADSE